jgi:hypothetical protein
MCPETQAGTTAVADKIAIATRAQERKKMMRLRLLYFELFIVQNLRQEITHTVKCGSDSDSYPSLYGADTKELHNWRFRLWLHQCWGSYFFPWKLHTLFKSGDFIVLNRIWIRVSLRDRIWTRIRSKWTGSAKTGLQQAKWFSFFRKYCVLHAKSII